MRVISVSVYVLVFIICAFSIFCVESSDFEQEFRLLSKQVRVLLNKRTEDVKMIEENIRKTIYDSAEMDEMRKEIKLLRTELIQLRSGKIPKPEQDKNDVLTMKWLYNSINEVKAEINEIQTVLNSSVLLQDKEKTEVTLNLLKSDVADINLELESSRRKNAKYEADLEILNEELKTVKENLGGTAMMCGKTKNQLKALQMDWNQNWKILNEKTPGLENEVDSEPSRHHKIIKKHIIRLEKGAKTLHKENYFLKTRIMELEDVIKNLQTEVKSTQNSILVKQNEVIPQTESTSNEQLLNITKQQLVTDDAIVNLTNRVSDLDKLHLSFLELLENVESIESKIEKSFPEYRKEISKLEVKSAESAAGVSMLKEDQKNIVNSLKAISFSVSNIQDKTAEDRQKMHDIEATVKNLVKSNSVQTSKLHDHILKLKALQMDWNQNWKILNEKTPGLENEVDSEPSRHHKIIKKHIVRLEKGAKTLHKENYFLKTRIMELEDVIKNLQTEVKSTQNSILVKQNEVIPQTESTSNEQLLNITKQQLVTDDAIVNLTNRVSDLDKLHLSFLELLENVESIESKIEKSFPEYRKEISKLEVKSAESAAGVSMLKEDQKNIVNSLKAISFSVSNIQDKTAEDRQKMHDIEATVKNLVKSNSVQTSKLHDHILKEESSSINVNATKSTIHLVQELRSFENEYKSIVNKLPSDCHTVEGPSGIYLISPGDGEPILAHCDQGWTTVQKRYDGSLNFNRNWNEYSNGFGSATGEHWLGNKNLHLLTKQNCSQLQINMKDIYGNYWQANYEDFRVADYNMGFKLSISRFNGNASDAFAYQNLMEFSTVDNDRDISNTHCASNYEGGWWFSHCQHANLNGRYNLGLTWFDNNRNEWIAVATSEMRVKRRDVC